MSATREMTPVIGPDTQLADFEVHGYFMDGTVGEPEDASPIPAAVTRRPQASRIISEAETTAPAGPLMTRTVVIFGLPALLAMAGAVFGWIAAGDGAWYVGAGIGMVAGLIAGVLLTK